MSTRSLEVVRAEYDDVKLQLSTMFGSYYGADSSPDADAAYAAAKKRLAALRSEIRALGGF